MFLLAQMLEMMASDKRKLSEIAKAIPPHYSLSGSVECNWSEKAKVMRLLVERYRDEKLELLDGVRIDFDDDSSILMVPHPSLARINVWTDASSKERAKALMERARFVIPQLASADENAVKMERQEDDQHKMISPTTNIPEERAFHFWIPGRYLGVQVRSLRSFVDVLHYIETASLEYHMERNDFANWLRTELGRYLVALDLEQISKARYKGEELRRHILECFGEATSSSAAPEQSESDELEEAHLKIDDTPAVKTIGGIKFAPHYQSETESASSKDNVKLDKESSAQSDSALVVREVSAVESISKLGEVSEEDSMSGAKAEQ